MRQKIASGVAVFLIIVFSWATAVQPGKKVVEAAPQSRPNLQIASVAPFAAPEITPKAESTKPLAVDAKTASANDKDSGHEVKKAVESKSETRSKVMAKKKAAAKQPAKVSRKQPASRQNSGSDVDRILQLANSLKGIHYRSGGSTPKGFDCSGFTSYVFKNAAGVSLPRTADGQAGKGTAVSQSNLRPGDIVYFQTYKKGPSHVGIYTGGGNFIHSSCSKGITVTNFSDSYYGPRYLGGRRIQL